MSDIFDIIIIGQGTAGAFCTYQIASQNKKIKILGIEQGVSWAKRKSQITGVLGCFPGSNGVLYQSNIINVSNITGIRKSKNANNQVNKILNQIGEFKLTKDRSPNVSMIKRLKKYDYTFSLNDYTQILPKDIHTLSRHMAAIIENSKNITLSFNDEVLSITKQKGLFVITTEEEKEYRSKRIILAVGRSGWRWAAELYSKFGIIDSNDTARFGVRIECNANLLKDFNKSNCSFSKGNIDFGPLCWLGTVIPEDSIRAAISNFRSNETRWLTDKVSFNLIANVPSPNNGFEQTDRISQLTYILMNERVGKERISSILNNKSKLSIMKEYDWLKSALLDLGNLCPEILTKGYFHAPTILPFPPKINLGDGFQSEVDGLYVIGESANCPGILGAMMSGIICGNEVCK